MEYFVYMTNDCNLLCQYCSVLLDCKKNNIPIEPTYSFDDLKKFIKMESAKTNDKEAVIYFFGGEPTLEYNKIYELIETLGTSINDINIKYILHTNGLLLENIPRRIANNIYLVMHSLNYEKIPKYNLNKSYFSTMITGLKNFRCISLSPVIARLTITEKTSLYTEIMQIGHLYDAVYWQIANCDIFNDFDTFFKTYTFEIELLFDYWFNFYKKGIFLNYVPFVACIKFMFDHDRHDTEFSCGYGKSMIYIQTDGNCYACSDNVENGIHKIGDIYNGVQFTELSLLNLRCKNCNYRYICMGRCGRMHKEFNSQHINEYCSLNKFMFKLFEKNRKELKYYYDLYSTYKDKINDNILEFTEFTP